MYIEAVILCNFVVDAIFAVMLCRLRRRKAVPARILLAALIGSGWATAYPLLPVVGRCVVKLLLCPLLALVAVETQGEGVKRKIGDFTANFLILAAMTFMFGGCVLGLSFLFDVYSDVSVLPWLIAPAAGTLAICVGVIVRVKSGKGICKTEVSIDSCEYSVYALRDSGNLLVDDRSGLPVVIVSNRFAEVFRGIEPESYIEVNTVGGHDVLPLYELEHVKVRGKTYKALCAVSDGSMNGFDVILQSSML